MPDGRVALVDPLGVAHEPFVLEAAEWIALRSWDAAAADGTSRPERDASSLADALRTRLSSAYLLDDEAFEDRRRAELDRYRALPARPASGAGTDYDPDPTGLRIEIGGLVANDWDMPPVHDAVGALAPGAPIRSAAPLYARCYAALRHVEDVARVVLLAVSRAPLHKVLVPSGKDLETPLGTVAVDAAALAALQVVPGRDELAHRGALVLERHALFLRVLFPRTPVLPLLVGAIGTGTAPPGGSARVEAAVEALQRVLDLPGKTLVIAASDLAHLSSPVPGAEPPGPEPRAPDPAHLRTQDRLALQHATDLEPEEFWTALRGRPRHAQHAAAHYLALRLFADQPALRGEVLGYLQIPIEGGCITTATAAFRPQEPE